MEYSVKVSNETHVKMIDENTRLFVIIVLFDGFETNHKQIKICYNQLKHNTLILFWNGKQEVVLFQVYSPCFYLKIFSIL